MAKTKRTKFNVAEHFRTPEEMAAYLEASIEEANGDATLIAKALGDIARAKGMSQVAKDAGLSRESLYKALSGERNPNFSTILRVISALGIRLHAEAAEQVTSPRTGPQFLNENGGFYIINAGYPEKKVEFSKFRGIANAKMSTNEILALTRDVE